MFVGPRFVLQSLFLFSGHLILLLPGRLGSVLSRLLQFLLKHQLGISVQPQLLHLA